MGDDREGRNKLSNCEKWSLGCHGRQWIFFSGAVNVQQGSCENRIQKVSHPHGNINASFGLLWYHIHKELQFILKRDSHRGNLLPLRNWVLRTVFHVKNKKFLLLTNYVVLAKFSNWITHCSIYLYNFVNKLEWAKRNIFYCPLTELQTRRDKSCF